MAEKTALARKIDVRLRSIRGQLEALGPHRARFGPLAAGDHGPDWDALEVEWRDTLHRLEWMHERFVQGEVSPAQANQHRQNLALLKKQMPVLRQLALDLPSGSLAT